MVELQIHGVDRFLSKMKFGESEGVVVVPLISVCAPGQSGHLCRPGGNSLCVVATSEDDRDVRVVVTLSEKCSKRYAEVSKKGARTVLDLPSSHVENHAGVTLMYKGAESYVSPVERGRIEVKVMTRGIGEEIDAWESEVIIACEGKFRYAISFGFEQRQMKRPKTLTEMLDEVEVQEEVLETLDKPVTVIDLAQKFSLQNYVHGKLTFCVLMPDEEWRLMLFMDREEYTDFVAHGEKDEYLETHYGYVHSKGTDGNVVKGSFFASPIERGKKMFRFVIESHMKDTVVMLKKYGKENGWMFIGVDKAVEDKVKGDSSSHALTEMEKQEKELSDAMKRKKSRKRTRRM